MFDIGMDLEAISLYPVSNHGIPESVIANALDAGKRFFALPLDTKMEVSDYWDGIRLNLTQETIPPD